MALRKLTPEEIKEHEEKFRALRKRRRRETWKQTAIGVMIIAAMIIVYMLAHHAAHQ